MSTHERVERAAGCTRQVEDKSDCSSFHHQSCKILRDESLEGRMDGNVFIWGSQGTDGADALSLDHSPCETICTSHESINPL